MRRSLSNNPLALPPGSNGGVLITFKLFAMKNYRIEQTTTTTNFVDQDGTEYEVSYVSGDRSVYEVDCPICGREHTIKGILDSSLLSLLNDNKCIECLKAEGICTSPE